MTNAGVAQDPPWITEAKKYLGLHEGIGAADNPNVVKFYADSGHPEVKHDSVPWCAAFVGGVLHRVDMKGTGTLWALDYAKWGQHLDKPVYGCIGAKKRVGGGHVTFILGETPSYYICLGGNQGDRVCIEAIGKGGFVALRWPSNVPLTVHPLLTSVPNLKTQLSEA